MQYKRIFAGFIGIILFIYIVSTLELEKIGNYIIDANPMFLGCAIIFIIIGIILRGLKWHLLVGHYGKPLSWTDSVRVFALGSMIGFLTPLKLGVFIRAGYVKYIGATKAIASVIVDRALDILFVMLIAFASVMLLKLEIEVISHTKILMVLILLLIVLGLCCIKKVRLELFILVKEILSVAEYKKRFAVVLALTIINFFITVISYFLVALALGIEMHIIFLLMVVSIIILIETLPVTFLGLGTREAGVIFMFSLLGFSPELAVSFSLIYLALNYVTLSVFGLSKLLKN